MTLSSDTRRFAEQFNIPHQVFSDVTITVELPVQAALSAGNVAGFLLAANLLSRTFPNVNVVFPPNVGVGRHPWHLETIDAVIENLALATAGSPKRGEPGRTDIVLSVGAPPTIEADRKVTISGSSWKAALDTDLASTDHGTLGSLYAACMGTAQVLLHSLQLTGAPYQPMRPHTFSLLDLRSPGAESTSAPQVLLPETHLVGVGAVGSAVAYALSYVDRLAGKIHLIDNERGDEPNLQRYALMRRSDLEKAKVHSAAAALSQSDLRVETHHQSFDEYLSEHDSPPIELLLSPVDSEEGRRALARTLPRRVINAATGGTTVTVSTHGFADGLACLHCLYMPELNRMSPEETMAVDTGLSVETVRELVRTNAPVTAELAARIERHRGVPDNSFVEQIGQPIHSFYQRAVCSDASIQLPTANTIAPLSFISASAGILMAAELVKVGHPTLQQWALDNYFRIDTLHEPNPAFLRSRLQEPSHRCICFDPAYSQTYVAKYVVGASPVIEKRTQGAV